MGNQVILSIAHVLIFYKTVKNKARKLLSHTHHAKHSNITYCRYR